MSQPRPLFIIGTRGSPLALAQARMTREALMATAGLAEAALHTEIISTTGDQTQDRPLSEIGGKGLFTKEIDIAQLEGRVDIAVHSAKDLPTLLPEGLEIAGFLPREDCRDAVIAPRHGTLAALPQGARVGTVSLRRQAMIRRMRPDLRVEACAAMSGRGSKRPGMASLDAVILAMAGFEAAGARRCRDRSAAAGKLHSCCGAGRCGVGYACRRRAGPGCG